MELRVLKYFLMVAREENITKAAQLLHVTQPTLSRQLMQLEEELGVQLFHRGKHNVTLTEDGMLTNDNDLHPAKHFSLRVMTVDGMTIDVRVG